MAFECGICASMFNTGARIPLILECGHTFCQSCVQHNLGAQRCCPYCRHPIQKHVDELPRNYALENAMEAANLPLVELMDRWGLAIAERMMVKADQLQLVSLMSRKGHTGEVWKGTLWGKPVAVKVLPLMDVEQRQLECLRREVAVLLHTTGECKQVCIYKGFCVKDGSFAIIMRLYSYSLAARVARAPGHRLPLPLALKYALDITKGLVELHRLGVTAADLKPDNVLIDDELGDAVIADFGISSVVTTTLGNGSGRGTAVRSSGALRGTPHYMAPEQFAPGARPTNKVDIWGFAATLLHMITGSPPWQHDTLLQICTAVGVAKQAPPLPEGLPPQLQALLLSCFDADPARRPAAVYLLRALQALVPILQQQAPVQLSAPQQQQHAAAAPKQQPAAVDDKRRGLDQYLAQLGLKQEGSPSSSSGGGGMPSAPPLPRTSSGGYGTSPALAASSGACISAHARSASCGSGGGSMTSSSTRVRAKLPRVLWSEEEALQEQLQGLNPGSTVAAAATAQHRPAWAPHHGRSASEQVSGMTSRDAQQHQQMLQALQPQEVAGAAQWSSSTAGQQHTRSRSDACHGWGSAAAAAAGAAGGDLTSSRRQQGGPESHMLPTHFEAAYSAESAAAAAADERAAVGDGAARRQRQQWQIPAHPAEQADGSSMQHCEQIFSPRGHDCREEAAGIGQSKWPATPSSETGAAHGMARHEPANGTQQQQQLAAGLQCTNYWDMPAPASHPTPDAAAAVGSNICSSSGKVPLPMKTLDAAAGEEAAGSLARHSNGACSSNGQGESCSGRTAGGPPSVSGTGVSRCGSARRNQRTLGNLLLGRAPSSRSFRAAEAAADADAPGSCGSMPAGGNAAGSSTGTYSSSLSAIRMAFGPASPDRMPRGSLSSDSSGIPTPATAVAVAAAGGVAVASAAAAAVGAGAAASKAGLACAASASSGAALTAAGAGVKAAAPVVVSVTAASATAAASGGGVVATMASRFSKGAKASSKDHPPAAAVVPLSPGGCSSSGSSCAKKNGRWRSLFGSPSRRQAAPQVASQAAAGAPCSVQSPSSQLSGPSVLDGSGVRSAHSSANGSVSCGDGACRAASTCSSPTTHLAPARSPGGAGGLTIVPPAGDGASIELPKLQGTPPGSAQAAAAHAISEADRGSGACSPLRAHAHNLSLHAKGTAASAESTPMASPNPVAPAAAASPSGAAGQQQPDSPSKGQHQQPGSSSGGDGSSGVVGGSHSQVLAEAVQLEARARSLSLSGRHEESEAALRASLALLGKQLGAGHPNTIAATTRLALQLNRHGKHGEAERLLRQVLTTKQAVLGRKHPQVAAASINLAACLYSQSHYNAAARLYSTALEIRRIALGDTHADTAACLNNLALCHSRLSEWPQAEQLFREALSARVAALGQLHPDVAITAHQLGHCLGQLGQHTEALVYHKQGLWVRQQQDRYAGSGTPDGAAAGSRSRGSGSGGGSSAVEDMVSSHRCVALCLARLGCDKQAGEHLSAVLDARSKQLAALNPPPPPGSATGGAAGGRAAGHCRAASSTSNAVASGTAAMDDVDWSILAEGDGRLSKAQSDALLAMAAAAEELGRCLSRQGRHSEAEEQFWRALEARSQVLGSRHEAVAATEEQLRACLEQQC